MITGRQVRAARALLNWKQEMLAEKALVALTTLKRMESEQGRGVMLLTTVSSPPFSKILRGGT